MTSKMKSTQYSQYNVFFKKLALISKIKTSKEKWTEKAKINSFFFQKSYYKKYFLTYI